MKRILTQTCITLLAILAAMVAADLILMHAADWRKICAYWIVLTAKNGIDWLWR